MGQIHIVYDNNILNCQTIEGLQPIIKYGVTTNMQDDFKEVILESVTK